MTSMDRLFRLGVHEVDSAAVYMRRRLRHRLDAAKTEHYVGKDCSVAAESSHCSTCILQSLATMI